MADKNNSPKEGLFSHTDDFNSLSEVTRKYPSIQEIEIIDKEHLDDLIKTTNNDKDIIPLFIKDNEGELHIISSYNTEITDVEKGYHLVYLGKPLDVEKVETVQSS